MSARSPDGSRRGSPRARTACSTTARGWCADLRAGLGRATESGRFPPLRRGATVGEAKAFTTYTAIDAGKSGMLDPVETIEAVEEALVFVGDAPVVLAPVMVAESGARLLDEDAEAALRERLLPRVTVV